VPAGLVVSPAGGRGSRGLQAVPAAGLGLGPAPLPRISVFMGVVGCHVNRSPVAGRIAKIAYKPGKFLNADLDKASEDNERNGFIIETPGATIGVVQIAGLIARRIVTFAREGAAVAPGERIGLIRFGSRVDVYLPFDAVALVAEGQLAVAGETVLAQLGGGAPPTAFRIG